MTPRKLLCDFQAGSRSPRASAASAPVPSSPSLHVHRHLLSAPDGTRAGFAVSDAGPTAPLRKPSQERLPSPCARGPRSSRPPSPHLSHVLGVTSFRKTRPACCQQRAAELAPVEMITETRDCDSARGWEAGCGSVVPAGVNPLSCSLVPLSPLVLVSLSAGACASSGHQTCDTPRKKGASPPSSAFS